MPKTLVGADLEEVEASLMRDLDDLGSLRQPPWSDSTLEEMRRALKHAADAVNALLA
jgi:hypothetical protein